MKNHAGVPERAREVVSSGLFPLAAAVLAGPLFVFPRERWLWVLLAVPLIWLGREIFGLGGFRRTPIDLAVAVLVLWVFLGMLRIPEIGGSVGKAAGFVYGIIVFYAVLEAVKSEGGIKLAVVVFLAASVGMAAVGTLNRREFKSMEAIDSQKVFFDIPKVDMNIEGVGAGVNPNPLGGVLLLFIPLGLMTVPNLLKNGEKIVAPKWRIPALAFVLSIVALDLAAVVYARSFGAWSALLFSLLILGRKKRIQKAILAVAVIAAVSIFWLKFDKPVLTDDQSLQGTIVRSISSRFKFWSAGIAAVNEAPVFGVGMDQFRLREGVGYKTAHAHNQYIHTAAEIGIPALAAYLAVLIGAGWMMVQIERSNKLRWMKDAAWGLAVGQAGFAVFGLADAIVLGAKPGVFFWVSLSLITAIYLSADSPDTEAKAACS